MANARQNVLEVRLPIVTRNYDVRVQERRLLPESDCFVLKGFGYVSRNPFFLFDFQPVGRSGGVYPDVHWRGRAICLEADSNARVGRENLSSKRTSLPDCRIHHDEMNSLSNFTRGSFYRRDDLSMENTRDPHGYSKACPRVHLAFDGDERYTGSGAVVKIFHTVILVTAAHNFTGKDAAGQYLDKKNNFVPNRIRLDGYHLKSVSSPLRWCRQAVRR